MQRKVKFELVQDMFVNLCMTLATTLLTVYEGLGIFFFNFLKAYAINLISFVILDKLGVFAGIAKKLEAKGRQKLMPLFIALIYATIITLSMVAINCGINDQFFHNWISTYFILDAVAIVAAYAFNPVSGKIVDKLLMKK